MRLTGQLYRYWVYWCGVSGTRPVYAVPHYAVVIHTGDPRRSPRTVELVGCRPTEGEAP